MVLSRSNKQPMNMPVLTDDSSDNRPGCFPKEGAMFPPIGSSSGSSASGSPADSSIHQRGFLNGSSTIASSRSTSTSSSPVKLPHIERSRTNSTCSFASSVSTRASLLSRRCYRRNGDTMHSPDQPNMADFEDIYEVPEIRRLSPEEEEVNNSYKPERERGRKRFKLPDIGVSNTDLSTHGVGGTGPRSPATQRISKKSSSIQNLCDQLSGFQRDDTIMDLRECTDALTLEYKIHKADSLNSLHTVSTRQTPVLFPIRHQSQEPRGGGGPKRDRTRQSRSRENRRSQSQNPTSAKTERGTGRSSGNLSEANFRQVVEKLEALSGSQDGLSDISATNKLVHTHSRDVHSHYTRSSNGCNSSCTNPRDSETDSQHTIVTRNERTRIKTDASTYSNSNKKIAKSKENHFRKKNKT